MDTTYKVAFWGELDTTNYFDIEYFIEKLITRILNKCSDVKFFVGRQSEFDLLASTTIRRVQKENPDRRCDHILILPYADSIYVHERNIYDKYYDDVILLNTGLDNNSVRDHMKKIANETICYSKSISMLKTEEKIINLAEIIA